MNREKIVENEVSQIKQFCLEVRNCFSTLDRNSNNYTDGLKGKILQYDREIYLRNIVDEFKSKSKQIEGCVKSIEFATDRIDKAMKLEAEECQG